MKNIIILTASFASVILIASSCVNLTQEPKSFITEEQYIASIDYDGLQKATTALYKKLWQNGYGFNCRMQRINVLADDITCSKTKAGNALDYFDALTPNLTINDADFSTPWAGFYGVINDANTLINNVIIPDDEATAKKWEGVLGEAYFMRALSYFYLVRIFGDVPLILSSDEALPRMPRTAVTDIYDKVIIPSLDTAIAWLPSVSRSGSSSTPSKWVAETCLADVYMTMAGWPLKKGKEYYSKAAAEAKDVINNSGLSLMTNYSDLWKKALVDDATEHMFGLHHSALDGVGANYGKSYYPIDFYPNKGWADYYCDEQFYLNYPDDDRKAWNIMTEWPVQGGTHEVTNYKETTDGSPAISKYYDYDYGAPGKNPMADGITCIYRYADVLLMYAECSTRATGTVDALALKSLNDVQNRAHSSITTTTNATEFENAVFNERGWEFFAEMKRWFDLVRLEKVAEAESDKWAGSTFKEYDSYYLPISNTQIELTGWTNNPGY
ncbi:MAG: RagB/SusD family nutrient uptake outer membrane protein [Bacteroidales bacterium]|jgi:hypothetical protein|nr:RagB/SusD family nutrient uptake outer membrane protein [Bacteroidales bacterium]MCI2145179.1 RagB/SusD family nutrient uptake outer membrane protein [Bacteroidales bacterium]